MTSPQNLVKVVFKAGQLDQKLVTLACKILNASGIIALPTDTLYGIAAKADDTVALDKIYKIKGRESTKPLAACISELDHINTIADTSHVNPRLLSCLLPGPITVVLNRLPSLNTSLNPGLGTIGIRIPDHEFIREITRIVGPLALTSANKSGCPSSLCVEDFVDLWKDLDFIFDAGALQKYSIIPNRLNGSTVVDLSQEGCFTIIREGLGLNRTLNTLSRFRLKQIKPVNR